MAFLHAPVVKLSALGLVAVGALAAMVLLHAPSRQACFDPLAADARAGPGFTALAAQPPATACLRIRLR